ncbi:MAG: DUF748 domain-containing protein [Planctomycetes bacterium]|nr:DUF748 domain-containing protein [Planctomycetota bacterium]
MLGKKKSKRKPTEFSPEERERRAEATRAAAATQKAAQRPRPWWRRLAKISVITLAILVVARVILAVAMPWIVDAAVRGFGLRASYDSLGLSLLGGSVEVTNLVLRTRTDDSHADAKSAPVADVDRILFDLDVSRLLTGRIAIHDVDVNGVVADLRRDAKGRITLGEQAVLFDPNSPAAAATEAEESAERPVFDFTSPVECSLFRIAALHVDWSDATLAEPLQLAIDAELRLENLGHADEPALLAAKVAIHDVVAALRVDGELTALGSELHAHTDLRLDGLRPARIRPLLDSFGIELHADEVDASLSANAEILPFEPDPEDARKPVGEVRGEFSVTDVWIRRDRDVPLRLDALEVALRNASSQRIAIEAIGVRSPHLDVQRREDGRLVLGFVSIVPTTAPADTTIASHEPSSTRASGEPIQLRVDRFELTEADIAFADLAASSKVDLTIRVPRLGVYDLEHGTKLPVPLRYEAVVEVPGVAEKTSLTGSITRDDSIAWTSKLRIDGLCPVRIEPYLRAIGLESELEPEASFAMQIDGKLTQSERTSVEAMLSSLVLKKDASSELMNLPSMQIRASIGDDLVRVERCVAEGSPLEVRRDASGSVHALGFSTRIAGVSPRDEGSKKQDAALPPVSKPTAAIPSFEIDELACKGFAITFRDESVEPTGELELTDVEIEGARLGFGPSARERKGTLGLRAKAGRVASIVALEASVANTPKSQAIEVRLRAEGLEGTPLEPWLDGASLVVTDGRAACSLVGRIARDDDGGMRIAGSIGPVHLDSGAQRLAEVESVEFDDLVVPAPNAANEAMQLGSWTVRKPRVRVEREPDGRILVAGYRLPVSAARRPDLGSKRVTVSGPAEQPAMPALSWGGLHVDDARCLWRDAAMKPVLESDFKAILDIDAWNSLRGDPLVFRVEVAAGKTLDGLLCKGAATIAPDAKSLAVACEVEGDGFKSGDLAVYLPQGMSIVARAGKLRSKLDASLAIGDEQSMRVAIHSFDYRDVGATSPWFAGDQVAFGVRGSGTTWTVEELVADGIEGELRKGVDGAFRFAGLRLEAMPPRPSTAETTGSTDAISVAETAEETVVPTVRLGRSSLTLRAFRYFDEALDGDPVDVACSVKLPRDVTLIQPDASALAPLAIELEGRVAPIWDAMRGRLVLSPYADEPKATLSFTVSEMHGDALQKCAPDIAKKIDMAQLDGATCKLAGEVTMRIRRRKPTDFPLTDGFGLEARITELALRDREQNVLAGVRDIETDVQRVLPTTGAVHIKELLVREPELRVTLEPKAIRVAGVRFLETDGGEVAGKHEGAPTTSASVAAPPTSDAASSGDFRLDLFSVDGLDFALEDESVNPPVIAPITSLDLEVKGFTTRALREPLPIAFHVFADGGKIELPERAKTGLFSGVTSAALGVLSGKKDEFKVEPRPFFGELAIQGRLTLVPKPEGFVKSSLDSMELLALRGLARKAGFEIGDGVLDSGVQVRFLGEKGMEVDSKTTFTYLSLDEPADGPISTYLKLPAPLDTVLFVLQNENGEQVIPFSFSAPADDLGSGNIVGAAVSSVAQVITQAIASSPFRIVGGVVDLVGGDDEVVPEPDAPTLEFEAGTVDLVTGASTEEALRTALARLRSDDGLVLVLRHVFGSRDLARAEILANPDPEQARDLTERLRKKREELLVRRVELAATTDTRLHLDQADLSRDAATALRELDRELARTERALDAVFELLKRGADRRRPGRTKRFALEIAGARMARVRTELIRRGIPEERVEIRRARIDAITRDGRAEVALTTKKRQVQ